MRTKALRASAGPVFPLLSLERKFATFVVSV